MSLFYLIQLPLNHLFPNLRSPPLFSGVSRTGAGPGKHEPEQDENQDTAIWSMPKHTHAHTPEIKLEAHQHSVHSFGKSWHNAQKSHN